MSKNKITTVERCDIWSLLSLEELIQPFYFDLAHHSKDQRGNIGEKFFSFREKHRSAAAKLISWCWHCTTGSTAWRGKAGGGGEGEVGGGRGRGGGVVGGGGGWGKGKQPPKVRRKALLCKASTNAILQNWISHNLALSLRRKNRLFFGHKISELFLNPMLLQFVSVP